MAADVFDDGGTWYANLAVLNKHTGKWDRSRPSTRVKVDRSSDKAFEASRGRALKVRQSLLATATLAAAKAPAEPEKSKTLAQAFAAREEALRVAHAAKKTIERFQNARVQVFKFFGQQARADGLGKVDTRRYAAARMKDGITADGVRRELVELRASCHEAGLPRPEMPDLPKPKSREGYTTKEDVLRICDELPAHRARVVLLVNQTGLRRNEVYRLRRIGPGQGRLEGKRDGLKTGPRTIPLTPLAEEILSGGPLQRWVNALRGLKNAARRAGVGDVTWNDLRAGTATQLLQADVAPARIAALLGHTSLRMVEQRYARLKNLKVTAEDLKALGD